MESSNKILIEDNQDEEERFLNSEKIVSIIYLLTKHKIKLWEMPDFNENKKETEDLVLKLSDESGLMEDELKEILSKLQKHSKKKLEDNKKFNQNGIAIFKLKIIGNNNKKLPKTFNEKIEICISNITGSEFKSIIMSKFELNCDTVKIICNGKILNEDSLLSSQEIKNHSTFLVMCVYQSVLNEQEESSKDFKLISDIKEAVSFLSENKMKNFDDNRFRLQNQNGVTMELSGEDNRCLTTAMILHEKAKNLIKSKEYIKALILLAEADNEFKNFRDTSLLEKVDNYALLNLDITWCYLCLQNLHELKNADERLEKCEKCLEKCYGANLERLTLIKSETSNKHIPVFVRINLLKAILNYHKGKKRECRQFLDIANRELQKIIIDEDKLTQVMAMGFSNTEARLALRASSNNVNIAIEQIFKKKQNLKEAKELEKQKKLARKLHENYGLTLDNKPIDTKVLNDIVQFGYTEKEAAKALIRSNNDFNLALDILQTNDDADMASNDTVQYVDEAVLNQLISMGFDKSLAKMCLKAFNNNMDKSLEFFDRNKESLADSDLIKDKLKEIRNLMPEAGQTLDAIEAELEKKKNAEGIISELAKEMPEDDEAYLDLNLEDDTFFINKYYSLLEF